MTPQASMGDTPPPDELRIGFIGLGEIGNPIAAHVLKKYRNLRIHNRTPERMQALLQAGATGCDSPHELAESVDLIVLCLFDADATESVLSGPSGLMSGARPGQLIIDLSTSHPARTKQFSTAAQDRGMGWVDAPVSGGPPGALAGTLAVMAGGAQADVHRAQAVLGCFASQVTYVGPSGCGQIAKICNQMINFGNAAAIAEAMKLASSLGLDPRLMPKAFANGFADSGLLRHVGPKMAEGTMRGRSAMTMKDMELALDLAAMTGSALPVTSLIGSLYRQLLSRGHTGDGIGGIARLYTDRTFAEDFEQAASNLER